jgi:hypothetical protein
MGNVLNAARQTYDRLWREAIPHFERGAAQIDPHLTNRAGDVRRGVTLALRLESAVQEAVELFLRQLAVSAPGQYFCRPDELHVTVLAAIHAIIGKVLKRRRPFAISFRGITASQGAVMIQGFPKAGRSRKFMTNCGGFSGKIILVATLTGATKSTRRTSR